MTNLPRAGRFVLLCFVVGSCSLSAPALGQWFSEAKLLPSNGAAEDQFGWSIAIDDGIVAVGAYWDDDNGFRSGSAYLFDAATGSQLAKLLPSDGSSGEIFGSSIAIDNGVVAVGAWNDDDNGYASGSAYLFDAATGSQIAKLLPSDGAEEDYFGYSIDIDNGIVTVGAIFDDDNGDYSGSAYLFDAATGGQITKLLPSDGAADDWFGFSIAINDGVVAVGAQGDDDNGNESGSVYLFDATTGTQIVKLVPNDGAADDRFGYSIAISNGIVVVGAYHDDDNGSDSGSAYLFDAVTGSQIAKLLPSDGAAGDWFSFFIAIDNGIVAVGAPGNDDSGSDSGSAYLFDAATGSQIAKLIPTDGASANNFGFSIAIDNGVIAVGANADDDNGSRSGSAYLFQEKSCSADTNADGVLDNGDLGAFITLFLAQDPSVDFTGDGIIDNGDIGGFITLFLAGC